MTAHPALLMPPFWRRFYLQQALALALGALALALLFHFTPLDLQLAEPWYDPATRQWPLRHAWWTSVLVHRWLRIGLFLAAITVWAMWWHHRHHPDGRRWLWLALCSGVVPLVVASSKRFSAMHCAWDVDRFAGYAPYFDVFSATPVGIAPGHCFPAAFVTSASWLMALGLWAYPAQRVRSWALGLAGFGFALGLGWIQQMRGAHFASHTLWSLWASWALIVLLHAGLKLWQLPLAAQSQGLASLQRSLT